MKIGELGDVVDRMVAEGFGRGRGVKGMTGVSRVRKGEEGGMKGGDMSN